MTEHPASQTLVQKIIGAKLGRAVASDEIVEVTPDVAMSQDDSAEVARLFAARGGRQVSDPDLHVIVLQCDPATDRALAMSHQEIRRFVETHGIENFFDVPAGIGDHVLIEQGFVLPGRLIVGSSPHMMTVGALGALALTVPPAKLADLMATGRIALRVPETARLEVRGRLAPGVTAHDLILRIGEDLARIGIGPRDGQDSPRESHRMALELAGPAIDEAPVAGRLSLCNLAAELGVAAAYVPPDSLTLAYLNGRARGNFELIRGDPDAPVTRTLPCDAAVLVPHVRGPDVSGPIGLVEGMGVNVVLIGGCAGGQLADMRAAAAILRGRRVATGVRLLFLPASSEILRAAVRDGTLLTLLEAGAILLAPGCGPCGGRLAEMLATGETALTCTPSRACGRRAPSGHDAAIYLASPLCCAASAVAGRITDPRNVADPDTLTAAMRDEA